MKQLIFILFILTFLIFKVKSEYKIKDKDELKIVETLTCLKRKGLWTVLLGKKKMDDDYDDYYDDDDDDDDYDYDYEDDYEDLVNWCARFCDRNGCKNLIGIYFFDDDDD